MQSELVPFSLDEVFDTLTAPLAEWARAKGIGFSVEVGPDVPRLLLGDPLRLRQVLTNLLSNAVQFTDTGWVRIVCWRAPGPDDVAHLEFEVADTGVGIDPSLKKRIFEPFAQGDGSTSRCFGGTGLRLHVSRRLVALMGGSLEVESVPAWGSVFRFSLSFARMNHAAESQRRALGAHAKRWFRAGPDAEGAVPNGFTTEAHG